MFHNVRLETESGHFVVATRFMFQTMPSVLIWGDRVFMLYEAGVGGYPSRYRERFAVAVVETFDTDPLPNKEPTGA